MEKSAPLFRVCHVNTEKGGAFVNVSLWEFFDDNTQTFCGMLRMSPESYVILQSILELGRRVAKCDIKFDKFEFVYDVEKGNYTKGEWSDEKANM